VVQKRACAYDLCKKATSNKNLLRHSKSYSDLALLVFGYVLLGHTPEFIGIHALLNIGGVAHFTFGTQRKRLRPA